MPFSSMVTPMSGAFGQLECAVGEFPSGVGSILQQV